MFTVPHFDLGDLLKCAYASDSALRDSPATFLLHPLFLTRCVMPPRKGNFTPPTAARLLLMTPPMPTSVIVFDPKKTKGAPDPEAKNQGPVPIHAALGRTWEIDAHFTLYTTPEPAWPRLNKEILPSLPEGSVWLELTALDWDTPGHKHLTPEDRTFFEGTLERAPEGLRPSYWYYTRSGARLLYIHGPVPPGDAEALHRGVVESWAGQGLLCDPGVWEWNRPHRLPHVLRDGKQTVTIVHGNGDLWDHTQVEPKGPTQLLSAPTLRLPQPRHEEAHALVWREKLTGKGEALTPWGREAKTRLKGRQEGQLDLLFEPCPPPVPDPRNPTLMKWIGAATNLLHTHAPGTTPAHIFGLFQEAAEQSTRQTDQGRDLLAETWKMTLYCWAREEARIYHEQITHDTLANGLLSLPHVPFRSTDQLTKHVVVKPAPRSHYVLTRDGYYRGPVSQTDLWPVLRDSGLAPDLVQIVKTTSQGERDMRPDEILNAYSTVLEGKIVRKPGPPRRGWVEGQDMVVGTFQRAPLKPLWDPEVDQWLRLLGGTNYQNLCKWIGLALAFERGPICALSIAGPPGIGKKPLVKGLAEAIVPGGVVTGNALGEWQYGLENSPFLNVNEAWPPKLKGVDGAFRALVTGDAFVIKEKYQPEQTVEIAPRLILTANNTRMVARLFGKHNETLDHEAVAFRLFHFEPDDAAARMFQEKGEGYCRGWISGGPHEQSDYIVARHFLALWDRHKDDEGGSRLLMENMTDPKLIRRMTTVEGLPSQVAETLAELYVQGALKTGENSGWRYVTVGQVLEHLEITRDLRETPSRVWIGRLLAPYRPHGAGVEWFVTGKTREKGHPLDMKKLRSLAEDLEYSTPEKEPKA